MRQHIVKLWRYESSMRAKLEQFRDNRIARETTFPAIDRTAFRRKINREAISSRLKEETDMEKKNDFSMVSWQQRSL